MTWDCASFFSSPLSFLGSVNGSYWGSFCLSAALQASVQISPASTFNTFVSTIRLGLWMVCHNQSWLVKSLINECLRQGFRLICMVDRDFSPLSLDRVCCIQNSWLGRVPLFHPCSFRAVISKAKTYMSPSSKTTKT